jgi:hypothetical protein
LFARWRNSLPAALRKSVATPVVLTTKTAAAVPFSRLTLTAQLEVLAQPCDRSWEQCAPLNPFLSVWQKRAAAGKLQVTAWPAQAERWLSGEMYARKFAQLIQAAPPSLKRTAARALQNDLLGKKLCSANLYPLLWAKET